MLTSFSSSLFFPPKAREFSGLRAVTYPILALALALQLAFGWHTLCPQNPSGEMAEWLKAAVC